MTFSTSSYDEILQKTAGKGNPLSDAALTDLAYAIGKNESEAKSDQASHLQTYNSSSDKTAEDYGVLPGPM